MHPELGLADDPVVLDLKAVEGLGEPGVDRLRERKAFRLGIENGGAVDRRVAIEGVDVQADEHSGSRRVHPVPALRDLDVFVRAARQHDLHPLFLQQRAQSEGQVEGDFLLHHGADDDPRVPELRWIAGGAAPVSGIDGDHVGRGCDEGRL